jgi:hypothetical protein
VPTRAITIGMTTNSWRPLSCGLAAAQISGGAARAAVRKKGSAQEFVEARILGGFLKNDEFGLGDRHALSLEQQIAEILVATIPSKKGFDVAVDGFHGLWAHMGWIITGKAMHSSAGELLPFVPDLRKDKFHVWISKWHWVPLTVLGIALFAIGGSSNLLWGIFLRTVVNLHGTWLVNSATHLWGSPRFFTGDASTNSFWVAMLTFGEGWHNNQHAAPRSARHGLAWYEFDLNWYGICAFRWLGLAWDIKVPEVGPSHGSRTVRLREVTRTSSFPPTASRA